MIGGGTEEVDRPAAATPGSGGANRRAGTIRAMHPLLAIVSNEKGFGHPVIGSPRLNRLGLHSARVLAASACSRVRRLAAPAPDPLLRERLWRDGFVVIENVLPAGDFERARDEFEARLREHEREVPRQPVGSRGFGPRLPNPAGFDRADGGSLNRFVRIDARCPTVRRLFCDDPALRRRLHALTGVAARPEDFWLYQLVHGDQQANPDVQRDVHCDTFHDTFKLWYFFEPVTEADGPFMYAAGSHRSDAARRAWERRRILVDRARSAAFRATPEDLREMACTPMRPVLAPANALVLANTRGFHCRGLAPAGTVRQGLYAGLRPHAFSLGSRG